MPFVTYHLLHTMWYKNCVQLQFITITPFPGPVVPPKLPFMPFQMPCAWSLPHSASVWWRSSLIGNATEKTIPRVLKEPSWYLPVKSAIEARANASQNNATPTDEFAGSLAEKMLSDQPEAVVRIGKLSIMMPLMKNFIPTHILYKILKKIGLGT